MTLKAYRSVERALLESLIQDIEAADTLFEINDRETQDKYKCTDEDLSFMEFFFDPHLHKFGKMGVYGFGTPSDYNRAIAIAWDTTIATKYDWNKVRNLYNTRLGKGKKELLANLRKAAEQL